MTINSIGYSRQQFAGPHVKGTAPLVTDERRYVASLTLGVNSRASSDGPEGVFPLSAIPM